MQEPKKEAKRAENKLKRDNDFGMPYHIREENNEKREAFMKSLFANQNFVPTYTENDKRFAEPVRETAKKFNVLDYLIIATFMVGGAGFAYLMTQNAAEKHQIINDHKVIALSLFTTIGAILGFGLGFTLSLASCQESKDVAVDRLYNRLSVRLFDSLHEMYPDLDENMLKSCNPEMARVIRALLIANMPESDTREIQAQAMKISRKLNNLTPNGKNRNRLLIDCNKDIIHVLSIIEHNMLTNEFLSEAILNVYRGSVPMYFTLDQQQKTK